MATGIVRPATFEWIIPRFQECLQRGGVFHSPDFHLPDSTWYLEFDLVLGTWYSSMSISLFRRDSGEPKTITYTIKINLKTHAQEIRNTCLFDSRKDYSREKLTIFQDMASYSNLVIRCYIEVDTPRPVAGKGIAIEKENFQNEDWSSIDMKDNALLAESMKQMLTKGCDHDVTICVQDQEFRAHRNILSTRSPVFGMMFSHDTKEKNTGTISIEDCDPESFAEFLMYVYSGKTENLTPSKALQLYYTADKYDFPVLKERCVSLLKTSLSVESVCDVVLLAAKHQEKELLDVATLFFARNMKKMLTTDSWQKFFSQNQEEANELLIKSFRILLPEN